MHLCVLNRSYYKGFERYTLFLNTAIILNTTVCMHLFHYEPNQTSFIIIMSVFRVLNVVCVMEVSVKY